MWRYDLNKSTEYLKYEFTDEEIAQVARDVAAANRKRASLEQRKKEVDAAIKAEVEKAKAEPIVTPPPYQQRIDAPEEVHTPKVVNGATLGPAALSGGTHQSKKRKRNTEAEGFADGSAE